MARKSKASVMKKLAASDRKRRALKAGMICRNMRGKTICFDPKTGPTFGKKKGSAKQSAAAKSNIKKAQSARRKEHRRQDYHASLPGWAD